MSIIKCGECGVDVSDKAVSCPKGGVAIAAIKKKESYLWLLTLPLVIIVIYYINIPSVKITSDNNHPTCKSDYRLCKDNADIANNNEDYQLADNECEKMLNSLAEYGKPQYDGSIISFPYFRSGDDYKTTGIVKPSGKVSMQNQFGATKNAEVTCEYDLKSKKVIKIYGGLNDLGGYYVDPNYDLIANKTNVEEIKSSFHTTEARDSTTSTINNHISNNIETIKAIHDDGVDCEHPVTVGQVKYCDEEAIKKKEGVNIKPSFDCAKAKSDSEKLICADSELAQRDNDMVEAFQTAKQAVAEKLPKVQYDQFIDENKKRWGEPRNNL